MTSKQRREIEGIERQFRKLDRQRIAACNDGDLGRCEEIDKEMEELKDRAERIRGGAPKSKEPRESWETED